MEITLGGEVVVRAWCRRRDDSKTEFPWGPAASPAREAATVTRQSAGWVSGGSRASAALVSEVSAKMAWRYDDGQNGDSKEEEETPGKDKGSGQDGAVDSKAMEVDKIYFGDIKQKSIPKEGN